MTTMTTPCILTTRSRDRDGYGMHQAKRFGRRVNRAHIVAWIDYHGQLPSPETPFILHRCDNPPCINVAHLYSGTQRDNIRDMHERGRHPTDMQTHCHLGHPFTAANTYRYEGRRQCRTCQSAAVRRYRMRNSVAS